MLIVPYQKNTFYSFNGLKVNIIGEDNIAIVNVKDFFSTGFNELDVILSLVSVY
jgi:hypothetical protein